MSGSTDTIDTYWEKVDYYNIVEEIVCTYRNIREYVGECDAEELSHTLLDPQTRNIVQLQVDDIGKFDKLINDLYGKAVEPRVKFLEEHLEEAHID